LDKLEDSHKSQIENMGKKDRRLFNGQDALTGEYVDFVSIEEEKQRYDKEITDLRKNLKNKFQECLSSSQKI
jgi:hypothetical protein